MKKHTLTFLALLLSFAVYSQIVIENPITGFSTARNVNLTKIELSDTATILYFYTKAKAGNWISIPTKTYIKEIKGDEKLYVNRSEGIPIGEKFTMPASGEVSYKLIFPAIDKTVKFIDYGEGNDGGSWFIYDIATASTTLKPRLPKELYGNWYNKSTGIWEVGFFDKHIVYKSKLWSYEVPSTKEGLTSLKLVDEEKVMELFLKNGESGMFMFGESIQELKACTKEFAKTKKSKSIEDKPYELPIFNIDSATYSGYLKGYTPRIGVKTLSISINDIITGDQNSFLIKIDDNGFFSVKVPIYYPHTCFVRSSIYNGSVFLEPGKELFHMIDVAKPLNFRYFMGGAARINSEIMQHKNNNVFNYWELRRTILDMSHIQYKEYCKNAETKAMNKLNALFKENKISARAYQVLKLNTEYEAAERLMSYRMTFEGAYRQKHKIPSSQRKLPIEIESPTVDYFDFISDEKANDPLAVVSSSYDSYINRLKYLEILRGEFTFSTTASSLAAELEKSGYVFTVSEKVMVDKLLEVEQFQNTPEQKAYMDKYGEQIVDFNRKYQDILPGFYKNNPIKDAENKEKYFIENGIELSRKEMQLLQAMDENAKTEANQKIKEIYSSIGDSQSAFVKKHRSFISELHQQKMNEGRVEKMNDLFHIKPGFASDLMNAQDICRSIVKQLTPVSEEELIRIQEKIPTPFIADYIAICNNQTIAKIEANKYKTGFVVNETPKTEADNIFDTMMQKYAGKVVYVDFWATWCGPCIGGIKRIKPLKEEMSGQNVAFVYITGPTSPEKTYGNMIPDIKGEHYRVSNDEWNYLKAKFNISGIPHYVLVGKNGEIINGKLGHQSNQQLKTLFEKHMESL